MGVIHQLCHCHGIIEQRNYNIVGLLCDLDNPNDYKSDSELPDNLLK